MTSSKFNNETIQLEIVKTGYGQYSFRIETSEGKFSKHSTNSILVDAINSDEDDTNDWGSIQDAIDSAVEMVLDANEISYELSN